MDVLCHIVSKIIFQQMKEKNCLKINPLQSDENHFLAFPKNLLKILSILENPFSSLIQAIKPIKQNQTNRSNDTMDHGINMVIQ